MSDLAVPEEPSSELPYDWVGGEGAVRALVDRFYDLMDLEPAYAGIRRLHPSTLDGSRDKPTPHPRQREADERAALREALSDEVDVESLLLTDDGLSFRRPGLPADVVTRLRRGQWSIQAQIDLHGLRREEARDRLSAFVRQALRNGQRCVRVVHGKGHGSPCGEPVLKAKVQRWLAQCAEVIAFAQATGPQGGAGALVVLLERRSAMR
jgi:DNA-nicking Smr family endonuclease